MDIFKIHNFFNEKKCPKTLDCCFDTQPTLAQWLQAIQVLIDKYGPEHKMFISTEDSTQEMLLQYKEQSN